MGLAICICVLKVSGPSIRQSIGNLVAQKLESRLQFLARVASIWAQVEDLRSYLTAQCDIFHLAHICLHHREAISGCRVLIGKLKSNSMSHGAPMYAILTFHMVVLTLVTRQPVRFITRSTINVQTSDFAHLKADALSKS